MLYACSIRDGEEGKGARGSVSSGEQQQSLRQVSVGKDLEMKSRGSGRLEQQASIIESLGNWPFTEQAVRARRSGHGRLSANCGS